MKLTPSQMIIALTDALKANDLPVLIKGKPGIGKSDVVSQAAQILKYDLMIVHPVVEDPTDAKGMPWVVNGIADFIPFGNLKKMMEATAPLIVFIDDFGQAAPSMQAAYMQLLLNRAVNGKPVSDFVRFVSATNRREDKAAVGGLLEPVKSRFATILELDVNTDDWVVWALAHKMPIELIAFVRFRPELLDKFEPTKDIINSPCPRTVAFVGKLINNGLSKEVEYPMIAGAVGEVFASEFMAYRDVMMSLPSIGEIRLNPESTVVPENDNPGAQYAVSTMIADAMNTDNIEPLYTYLKRMPKEFMAASFKIGHRKNPSVCHTETFQRFTVENREIFN